MLAVPQPIDSRGGRFLVVAVVANGYLCVVLSQGSSERRVEAGRVVTCQVLPPQVGWPPPLLGMDSHISLAPPFQ